MNIIKKRIIWYIFSIIISVLSVLALLFWGLKPGADFTGGTLIKVGFNTNISAVAIKDSMKDLDLKDLSVSNSDNNIVQIKTEPISKKEVDKIISTIKINLTSNKSLGITKVEELQVQTIGPTVGSDMTKRASIAVCVAVIGIILYIAWAFRKVQQPFSSWSMSIATVVALCHDILIILGFVSTINHFYGFEANSYLLVALLTVLGFSVHDTIVVFDRIRENLLRSPHSESLEKVVDSSIDQTLARSINTSVTAILVLLALTTIGGGSIRPFVLTLLAGITIGTYSSIFVASPLLVTWNNIKHKIKKSRS